MSKAAINDGYYWEKQEIVEILKANGHDFLTELPIDHGKKLRFKSGAVIKLYDSGSIWFEGEHQKLVEDILYKNRSRNIINKTHCPSSLQSIQQKVVVIFLNESECDESLINKLCQWGIYPLIIDGNLQPIDEALKNVYINKEANFAIAVVMHNNDIKNKHVICQNAALRLGILVEKFGKDKVAILMQKQWPLTMEFNLPGLKYFHFRNSTDECSVDLAKAILNHGYSIAS